MIGEGEGRCLTDQMKGINVRTIVIADFGDAGAATTRYQVYVEPGTPLTRPPRMAGHCQRRAGVCQGADSECTGADIGVGGQRHGVSSKVGS